MKMEPIVSSETSAIKSQTPGNYPKRNKLHTIQMVAILVGVTSDEFCELFFTTHTVSTVIKFGVKVLQNCNLTF